MIPALAPLFVGELAPYRDALVLPADPRPSRPVREWLAPATFDAVLQAFGASRGAVPSPDGSDEGGLSPHGVTALSADDAGQRADADRMRGLASEWSKAYLLRLLPPVLAATVVLGHRLPLAMDDMGLVLDDAGRPVAFRLPDAGSAWPPARIGNVAGHDPFHRFAPLIDAHLAPFVDALAAHSRLSPRVFWSNAGNYVEWLVGAIAAKVPADRMADANALLALRQRVDGRENPLYRPVRYRMEGEGTMAQVRRRRRVCCVRYLVPDTPLCANCPLTTVPGTPGAGEGVGRPDGD